MNSASRHHSVSTHGEAKSSIRPGAISARRLRTLIAKLTEIAPEEIVNAFVAIVADAGVIERSELVGITATVFGMSRVTAQARTHLDAVLQWAIDQEEVVASGDLIELAPLTDRPGLTNGVVWLCGRCRGNRGQDRSPVDRNDRRSFTEWTDLPM